MGCGASSASRQRYLEPEYEPVAEPRQRDEAFLPSACNTSVRTLADLPEPLAALHHHLPPSGLRSTPSPAVRLLRIQALLAWPNLKPYEDVPTAARLDLPYDQIGEEVWAQTAAISWRRHTPVCKPGVSRHHYLQQLQLQQHAKGKGSSASCTMGRFQFLELCAILDNARSTQGLVFVWIDYCCMPQANPAAQRAAAEAEAEAWAASAASGDDAAGGAVVALCGLPDPPMLTPMQQAELLRSRVYYARARAMFVVPSYRPLRPGGIARQMLTEAAAQLRRSAAASAGAGGGGRAADEREAAATAASVLESILKTEYMARRDYWGRAWTAAERLARHGCGEAACHWLSLEAWVGMAVEAAAAVAEEAAGYVPPAAAVRREEEDAVYYAHLGREAAGQLVAAFRPVAEAGRAACGRRAGAVAEAGEVAAAGPLSRVGVEAAAAAVAGVAVAAVGRWASQEGAGEAPSEQWLKIYLGQPRAYQATHAADRVWAVYAYFASRALDAWAPVGAGMAAAGAPGGAAGGPGGGPAVLQAVHELVGCVPGARRWLLLCAAAGAGVAHLVPLQPVDRQLLAASHNGATEAEVEGMIQAEANMEARDEDGDTPLYNAACQGHQEVVRALVAAGANREAHSKAGATPLYIACETGRAEVVKQLLEGGADQDAPKADGSTPLYVACQNAHLDVVRLLLAAGADKDAPRQTGATPLFIAAQFGHVEVVRLLLAAGADTEAARHTGSTPLFIAAQNGHVEVVRLLVGAGANKRAANKNRDTPRDIADNREIKELLA